jgi:hypothetical protein
MARYLMETAIRYKYSTVVVTVTVDTGTLDDMSKRYSMRTAMTLFPQRFFEGSNTAVSLQVTNRI